MQLQQVVIFDDAEQLMLTPNIGLHRVANWVRDHGHTVRLYDMFRGLPGDTLAKLVSPAPDLVVVHTTPSADSLGSTSLKAGYFSALLPQLAVLRKTVGPQTKIVLAGPLAYALSAIPVAEVLAHADAIFVSGSDLYNFLASIFSGKVDLRGNQRVWGSDVMPDGHQFPAESAICSANQFPWRARYFPVQKRFCDGICSKCSFREDCPVDRLPQWPVIEAQQAQLLQQQLERELAQGGRLLVLDDQVTYFTPDKLKLLGSIAKDTPAQWVLDINLNAVINHPGFLPALKELPVVGAILRLPAFTQEALTAIGTPGDYFKLLAAVRAAIGPEALVEVSCYFGFPFEGPATMQDAEAWSLEAFDSQLLDIFSACPAYLDLSAPLAWSGHYRFPFPGRRSAFGLPYWETDLLNSDHNADLCQELNDRWAVKLPFLREYPSVDLLAGVVNASISLAEVRQACHGSATDLAEMVERLAAARTIVAQAYRNTL